uniref:EF-hand domain-containing protein n=1 Tax=Zooxanthella nutricula TaxID=1333877 RepID=A0A7S2QN17_9DINO
MPTKRLSIEPSVVELPEDEEAATETYIKLRHCIRDAFEGFLRNVDPKTVSLLEQALTQAGGEMNSATFLKTVTDVFPRMSTSRTISPEEELFVQQMACLQLFESVDVDGSGQASWMELCEFVCAIAEELRLQVAEESGQTFDFEEAEQVALPFRPAITKCHFDKIFYWMDNVVVFEEGQAGFHLHFPKTMVRRRRVEGHRQEILSAAFLADFNWVVTSGNDNTVCFWDDNFNLVKRWTIDHTWTGEKGKVTSVGALCWCPEIHALYASDHFSQKVRAWRLHSQLDIRFADTVLEPDKTLELRKHMTHEKSVTAICWMSHLKCLATASLDTTVQIFDLVQMKRTWILQGHKRGLTCLRYCPKGHMLLSCGFDNYICIWDPGAGVLSFTLKGHECSIAGLCAIPNMEYEFMSVDFEGQVRLWDVRRLVCVQSFAATDKQAEKNGELEALEPRAICALGQNRVLISGRRMVVYDREAPNPHLTADWPIHSVAFNSRRIEIVTPIKNDLYVWCALTGVMRAVHDNVIEGTITAMTLGRGERRIFVGADDGSMRVVNYACGALLKELTKHQYEVSQISCIPEKVLTMSAPERLILVHDDTQADRSVVLKRIDTSRRAVTQFAFDNRNIISCVSEECQVVWYNVDFAKEVGNSDRCPHDVRHESAISCCMYFDDAPLLVTADTNSTVTFWSIPPLRTYSFFNKVTLSIDEAAGALSVTSIGLSWPDEECMFVGFERGMLACVDISAIVQKAKRLRAEIERRKESGEAAEVISGRIFEKMPMPCNSPEYMFQSVNRWVVPDAHRGSADKIIVCRRQTSVLLTLGVDQRVRMWLAATGEALGTLEQGLPGGLTHRPETQWRLPIHPRAEISQDVQHIEAAAEEKVDSDEEETLDPDDELASAAEEPATPATPAGQAPPSEAPEEKVMSVIRSATDLRAGSRARLEAQEGSEERRPRSATGSRSPTKGSRALSKPGGSRLQALAALPKTKRRNQPEGEEWYAGQYSPGYWAPAAGDSSPLGLPRLQNGRQRPRLNASKDLVAAARRLSSALGDVRNTKDFV